MASRHAAVLPPDAFSVYAVAAADSCLLPPFLAPPLGLPAGSAPRRMHACRFNRTLLMKGVLQRRGLSGYSERYLVGWAGSYGMDALAGCCVLPRRHMRVLS